MNHIWIPRRLKRKSEKEDVAISQSELLALSEPLLILGDAGMGKTTLLEWLEQQCGYTRLTARALLNKPSTFKLSDQSDVLLIDALDEVSESRVGTVLDSVLQKLGELGYPRFVLSCRVADWHGAIGKAAILDQYQTTPVELQLLPFDDEDVLNFLSQKKIANPFEVITHFSERGLEELLRNPQTLDMIASVALQGALPTSRSELFERAIEVLQVEFNGIKEAQTPALESEIALNAAGAACAALILTGSSVLSRRAKTALAAGDLATAEIASLPCGNQLNAVLGSRLFIALGSDRFAYCHRNIAEFLAARYLARLADTERKRRRLLARLRSHGVVPSSLRGLHAWLANEPTFATRVIEIDPLGLITYGSADNLSLPQARCLLRALEKMAAEQPESRLWDEPGITALARPELLEDINRLIFSLETPFGVRMLLLKSIKGRQLADELSKSLLELVLDEMDCYACRIHAAEALVVASLKQDWSSVVDQIRASRHEDSLRLAINLLRLVGFESFSDQQIAELAFMHGISNSRTVGVLYGLEKYIPDVRLGDVLDLLAKLACDHKESDWLREYELIDLLASLITRRLSLQEQIEVPRLWCWLEPLAHRYGGTRERRKDLAACLLQKPELCRKLQHFVLLEVLGDDNLRFRAGTLHALVADLYPDNARVIELFVELNPADHADERWRDLLYIARHDQADSDAVRTAARPFARSADAAKHLAQWGTPPEWELRERKEQLKRKAKEQAKLEKIRQSYRDNLDGVRTGEYRCIIGPAQCYLGLIYDHMEEAPHQRITGWLSEEISVAASCGFEAYLTALPEHPTASDIAHSLAQNKSWDAGYIIVTALAERLRNGTGFANLRDERLMAGLFVLAFRHFADEFIRHDLMVALSAELQCRGSWEQTMRLFHEPQLAARCENVYWLEGSRKSSTCGHDLAVEWLHRFERLPWAAEKSLVDILWQATRYTDLLKFARTRKESTNIEQRHLWTVLGLLLDFETFSTQFAAAPLNPSLIWVLEEYTSRHFWQSCDNKTLMPVIAEWIVSNFSKLWSFCAEFPKDGWVGRSHPRDASKYLEELIFLLGADTSDAARAALLRLRDEADDGYSESIRRALSEQIRAIADAEHATLTLSELSSILADGRPDSATDLQAFMLEELKLVAKKIRSDDVDSWRGFYDEKGVPFGEERCRDHLLGLLRQGQQLVELEPEKHVADDKEVDITCSSGNWRLPVEIKGQWHRDLWTAADQQLDRLYTSDWRAGNQGIYLVLWFGKSGKKLLSPGRGQTQPQTPEQLREMLIERSKAAQSCRVEVVVLDVSRTI